MVSAHLLTATLLTTGSPGYDLFIGNHLLMGRKHEGSYFKFILSLHVNNFKINILCKFYIRIVLKDHKNLKEIAFAVIYCILIFVFQWEG